MAKGKPTHSSDTISDFIEKAKSLGIENDYMFLSTLERYQMQVNILENLKKIIDEESTLVTKEYVKGRENVYTHPAITEFNKTTDSANKTVITLDNLIKSKSNSADKKNNALLEALAGD